MSIATEELEKIKIISSDVKVVMGETPPLLMRIGSLLILSTVVIIIVVASLIPFTQIVAGRVHLEWNTTQRLITARSNGNILEMKVKEGQWVKSGDFLFLASTSHDSNHIYTAPVAGNVHFIEKLYNGAAIWGGDHLLTIDTDSSIATVTRVVMVVLKDNMDKMKQGLPVTVTLDAYPERTNGFLTGTVDAARYSDSVCTVIIKLDEKQPAFKNLLRRYAPAFGSARIIVSRESILRHIIKKK